MTMVSTSDTSKNGLLVVFLRIFDVRLLSKL